MTANSSRPHAPYDPKKAHEYYEQHKKLKGHTSSPGPHTTPTHTGATQERTVAVARVNRLKGKVATLTQALSVAEAAYSKARQTELTKKKASSDGKSTTAEKVASQNYRDKHKQELKSKAKQDNTTTPSSSSGGSKSSSSSSSSSVTALSTDQLSSRISKIKSALADAKSQLSSATQKLGQLAHSEFVSDPEASLHFAQFRSERIPPK